MTDIESIKNQIVEQLKPLRPEKVILFGSYAWGEPEKDSDLDIYVVTNDDFIPQNFKEKKEIRLKVSKAVRNLQKNVPIDVVTHTKKMHQEFLNLNSNFCQDIMEKGIRLL